MGFNLRPSSKASSFGDGGTGCLSCDEDEDVVAATVTFIVFILAIIIAAFVFGQRTMDVLRPVARSLGGAVHVDPGLAHLTPRLLTALEAIMR